MSEWYKIKDADDVSFSLATETIDVLFKDNDFGNVYIEIPVEFILNKLPSVPK